MLRKGRSAEPEPPETGARKKSPGVRGPGTEARKQALKSETAVNNVQLCIIWFDYKTDLHNNSKYHAL